MQQLSIAEQVSPIQESRFFVGIQPILGCDQHGFINFRAALLPSYVVEAVQVVTLSAAFNRLGKLAPVLYTEKVDSQEEANNCNRFGFDRLQRHFYARPGFVSCQRAEPRKQLLLRLPHQLSC
ncbi:MAG: hypothetical protein KGM83_06745 [Betaproteobacteria bacterium]|nr:hypothetical protein [Betaproteobacteria bacterium]